MGSSFYLNSTTPGHEVITLTYSEKVVTLTDASPVAVGASLGNVFDLTATADRTISAPTNSPATGKSQKILLRLKASGADRTFTLTTGSSGAFRYGTNFTSLTTTTSGTTDQIGAIWNESASRWDVVAYSKGF